MFGWAITLGVIALIAAILGFGGIAGALAKVALFIFAIALIGAIIFLVLAFRAGKAVVD